MLSPNRDCPRKLPDEAPHSIWRFAISTCRSRPLNVRRCRVDQAKHAREYVPYIMSCENWPALAVSSVRYVHGRQSCAVIAECSAYAVEKLDNVPLVRVKCNVRDVDRGQGVRVK